MEIGLQVRRIYVVGSFGKGTIRGLHAHKYETKAYFVLKGAAKFVIQDSDGRIATETLSSAYPEILVIPPNHPHGWTSLAEDTLLLGLSDRTLEQTNSDDQRTDPFSVGSDVWSVKAR